MSAGIVRARPSASSLRDFRRDVYRNYARRGRSLPWRRRPTPYRVLVSEVMLQQTRAALVADRFPRFVARFPGFRSLARAPLREILSAWRGLGYNRRALSLKRLAARVVSDYGGRLPRSPELLAALPGLGRATACSVAAFAFGEPVAFVETNVRAAFLHAFFPLRRSVRDREILPLVERALDRRDPRRWYNALMDYGAMVKELHGNPGRRSARHRRQPAFEGSDRQVRGRVLRALLSRGGMHAAALSAQLGESRGRLAGIVRGLERDGLVREEEGRYSIA